MGPLGSHAVAKSQSGTAGSTDPTTGNIDINTALAASIDQQVLDLAHELSHSLDVANGDAADFRSDTFDVPNADHQVAANVGEALAYEATNTVAQEANIDVSNGFWPDWTSTDLKDAGGFQNFYDSISGLVVSALDSSSYSDLGKSGSSSNSDDGKADTSQPVYSDE